MNNQLRLDDPVTLIKGVGASTSEKLERLSIETVIDLLNHYPSRYYDFTEPVKINHLKEGKTQSFVGITGEVKSFFSKSGKLITQCMVTDKSGKVLLTWFNNPYIKRLLKENTSYTIAGKVSFWGKV